MYLWINPLIRKIVCWNSLYTQSFYYGDLENEVKVTKIQSTLLFWTFQSAGVILKIRSRSPKSNKSFSPPKNASLQVWSKSIHWFRRKRTETDLRGRPHRHQWDPHQDQCSPPPPPPPPLGWGDIISLLASLDMILFNSCDQTVWMCRLVCCFVVCKP